MILFFVNRKSTKKVPMSTNKSDSFLSDFGINSAEILSNAIQTASKANWKHHHIVSVSELTVSDSITLSASMFGAICLFTNSLIGMNKKWIKQEKAETSAIELLNGTIMFLSGGVILFTSITAFKILFKR